MNEHINDNDEVKVFLKNGFLFQGRAISKSEYFLTIQDRKTDKPRSVAWSEISNFEVLN